MIKDFKHYEDLPFPESIVNELMLRHNHAELLKPHQIVYTEEDVLIILQMLQINKDTTGAYQEVISMSPDDRIREKSNDKIHDKISGILVAYSMKYEERKGWIDIITIKDAVKEIKQLILEYGTTKWKIQ